MSKSLKTGFGLKAKLSSVLLLFALLLSCIIPCPSAQAATSNGTFVVITGSTVNIRKGPGTNYDVDRVAYANRAYRYVSKKTVSGKVWYEISLSYNHTGWVISTYAGTEEVNHDEWGVIQGTLVNGRSGPGTTYGHIYSPGNGVKYSYVNRGRDTNGKIWYELISDDAYERIVFWVISDYCYVNVDYI